MFFFLVDDDLAVAVVVVVAIVSMFAVEVFVGFVMVDSLVGVFFFPPPFNDLGPALFFVGAVPGFSFRGFVFVYFGRCCLFCCYSCRCVLCVRCRFCCCCGRSCFGCFLRAGF